jgi:hypothetical protein
MRRDLGPVTISPDSDALEALGQMQAAASRLLVVEGGRLVGVVSLKDLIRFLDLKAELDRGEVRPENGARPCCRRNAGKPHPPRVAARATGQERAASR